MCLPILYDQFKIKIQTTSDHCKVEIERIDEDHQIAKVDVRLMERLLPCIFWRRSSTGEDRLARLASGSNMHLGGSGGLPRMKLWVADWLSLW